MKMKPHKPRKPLNRIDLFVLSLLIIVGIYLFVSAPIPLPLEDKQQGERLPVAILFQLVAEENNTIRKQWTKDIVGAGKKVGFKFAEDWRKKGQDEGPLPAFFLRNVAAYLEKSSVPLSLFLGSDFPINAANQFKGQQAKAFQIMKNTSQHQYFFDNDVKRYTAMFPDYVVVETCAKCHNEHPETPKNDWLMGDVMGATTWTYPHATVTRDELITIIIVLRRAFAKTYAAFLQKSQTFSNKPPIGKRWPVDGYFLPDSDVFMQRFEQAAATATLRLLLQHNEN